MNTTRTGIIIPKTYQQQPWLPEYPPPTDPQAPEQLCLFWLAPETNSLPSLMLSVVSGSNSRLAAADERDTLFAICTMARHAHDQTANDEAILVNQLIDSTGEFREATLIARTSALHKLIGRDNDPQGRRVTSDAIEVLGYQRLQWRGVDANVSIPLVYEHGQAIGRLSETTRDYNRMNLNDWVVELDGEMPDFTLDVARPANQYHKDPYVVMVRPSRFVWNHILGDWWEDADIYARLSNGRPLYIWLKGQLQNPIVRQHGRAHASLRHLYQALGLNAKHDAYKARRTINAQIRDIQKVAPTFLPKDRQQPIKTRKDDRSLRSNWHAVVEFNINMDSDHVASAAGKQQRKAREAEAA